MKKRILFAFCGASAAHALLIFGLSSKSTDKEAAIRKKKADEVADILDRLQSVRHDTQRLSQ